MEKTVVGWFDWQDYWSTVSIKNGWKSVLDRETSTKSTVSTEFDSSWKVDQPNQPKMFFPQIIEHKTPNQTKMVAPNRTQPKYM